MLNFQFELFQSSIDRFARTIVLKDPDAAMAINRDLMERRFAVNTADPRTWKYYLRLAGKYHESDQVMTVVSLDTQETIIFNRENLTVHLATKREYYYGSEYYKALVERYPDQVGLIQRIINPIDVEVAIAAKPGTILYYDTNEVEPAETNLIPKLQEAIYTWLRRWDTYGYRKTDELYAAALFGTIYAFIPALVRTIRRENCHTYQAHSFHIWSYLESNGRLGEYRRYLNTKQAMWLYRNIRWVNRNAGKNQTFNELLRVILSERNIPLGAYSFEPDVSSIAPRKAPLSAGVGDNFVDTSGAGLYPTARLLRTPLNLLDIQDPAPTFKTVLEISEQQVGLARDNASLLLDSVREVTNSLINSSITQLPIKAYESEMIDLTDQKPYTFYDTLLNHWLDLGTTARYNAIINVTNSLTGDVMSMNAREAFVVWLYAMNKLNGITFDPIPVVGAHRVRRRRSPSFAQLRRMTSKHLVPDSVIQEMLESQPELGTIISTESFYRTCKRVHDVMMVHYKLIGKQSHYKARGQIDKLLLAFYCSIPRTIADDDGQTFSDFFSARGWQIQTLPDFDLEILAKSVFEKATGIDTQAIISLKDLQGTLLRLMSRLGTYSTHYLQKINEAPAIVLNPVQIRIGDYRGKVASTQHFSTVIEVESVDVRTGNTHEYSTAHAMPIPKQQLKTKTKSGYPLRITQVTNAATNRPYNAAVVQVRSAGFVPNTPTP